MQEQQLINKLKKLQQIKPRKDWVLLVRNQILELPASAKGFGPLRQSSSEASEAKQAFNILSFLPALIYQRKLAYAFLTLLFVMVGMFSFAQYTMPGDALFSIKKLTEQSQTAFVSQENQLKNDFETASKRLDDLTQVVKDNKMENIAPAIREFQESIAQATKNLVISIGQKNSQSIKDIALQIKEIENNKKQLQTYGVDLGATQESKDLNNALAPLVQREIDDLEKTTLTEDQQKTMQEVRDLYAGGKYSDALEIILTINN